MREEKKRRRFEDTRYKTQNIKLKDKSKNSKFNS
jgi:hypothetical protein